MKKFKEIMFVMNNASSSCVIYAVAMLLSKNYQMAAWVLLATSILFAIGYFVERWSK